MKRILVSVAIIGVVVAGLATQSSAADDGESTQAYFTSPVATDDTTYAAYGRVFPDPQGCNQGQPGYSPWSKGNVCAFDFLQFQELQDGLAYLQDIEGFGDFIEVYKLHEDFDCRGLEVNNPDEACKAFRSAGLPVTASGSGETVTRDRAPLVMVRVTDEAAPDRDKKY